MIKTPVVVKTETGFDGRPIALLVQEASQYASKIYIQIGEKNINAKSIMGMMSLSLADGEKITVVTEGEDDEGRGCHGRLQINKRHDEKAVRKCSLYLINKLRSISAGGCDAGCTGVWQKGDAL